MSDRALNTARASRSDSSSACESCPSYRPGELARLGLNIEQWDYLIALAGNPNTGKSTVFNNLTGLRQHTGNWPGKTVIRAEGGFSYAGSRYKLVDLPGTYSLLAASPDEEVARNFLLFAQPDVTVVVVDATRLERNLNLVLQILEITPRVVLCLNLMDQARRNGLQVDDRCLARDLGIPVVATSARYREGLDALLLAIHDVASGKVSCRGYRLAKEPPALRQAVQLLAEQLETIFPGLPNVRWVALRLLEGDDRVIEAVRTGELSALAAGVGAPAAVERKSTVTSVESARRRS